jgi:hypothetical protein
VESFSSFVGPKKPTRNRDSAGRAAQLPRQSISLQETVLCPSCKVLQSVRTSKTQANPDRQVMASLCSCVALFVNLGALLENVTLLFQFFKCDSCNVFKWLDELGESSAPSSASGGERSNRSYRGSITRGNSFGSSEMLRGGVSGGKSRGNSVGDN